MKKTPRSWRRVRMGSHSRKRWARALALTLVFALAAPLGGWVTASGEAPAGGICIHHPEHDDACGYVAASEGAPCSHVHDASCGYIVSENSAGGFEGLDGVAKPEATGDLEDSGLGTESTQPPAQTPGTCNHVHDDACGYAEAAQGHPCNFLCPWCVTGWEWDDEEELLVWDWDVNPWGLGVPGTDAANPLTREALEELLPQAVTAQTAAGEDTVSLVWDFGAFPEEGAYQGTYTLTASLEGEYVLTETAPELNILLDLGGGGMYEDKPKYLNQWNFVAQDGSNVKENNTTAAAIDLPQDKDAIVQWLEENFLPTKIRGWVSASDVNNVFGKVGFSFDVDQSERKWEMTANGPNEGNYNNNNNAFKWGRVNVK